MANAFLGWLNQLVASLASEVTIKQIGILTLSRTDDTPAFTAFRNGMRGNGYIEGKDISLHFRFAADETELTSLAAQLLRIPNMNVIVTGGTKAFDAVNSQRVPYPNVKIVQAVGGDPVPTDPKIRGFHIDALQVCKKQVDKLINHGATTITVLVDSAQNPKLAPLTAYAATKGATINPLVAATSLDLNVNKFNAVAGSFMIIPNGMFFDNAETIARLVDAKDIWKIYPEREYKAWHEAHGNPAKVRVFGHKIRETYKKAAQYVSQFLENDPLDPSTEAPDKDEEP
jgi:hypothetical protein